MVIRGEYSEPTRFKHRYTSEEEIRKEFDKVGYFFISIKTIKTISVKNNILYIPSIFL